MLWKINMEQAVGIQQNNLDREVLKAEKLS
jgi:hypothetical protein